jgi:hypothetical protein
VLWHAPIFLCARESAAPMARCFLGASAQPGGRCATEEKLFADYGDFG